MRSQRDLILIELLVLRCRRGEPEAARELVAMFQAPLLYFVRRLVYCEADAWDIVQETWLNVFRTLRRLKEPRAFPAYLYAAARNNALAHLRRGNARDAMLKSIETPAVTHGDEEPVFTADDAAALHAALGRLSLVHREALSLFFFEELSIDEIASVVAVPPGTIKSRLHHAKRALRQILDTERIRE